jgi:hypothetical protein
MPRRNCWIAQRVEREVVGRLRADRLALYLKLSRPRRLPERWMSANRVLPCALRSALCWKPSVIVTPQTRCGLSLLRFRVHISDGAKCAFLCGSHLAQTAPTGWIFYLTAAVP